MRDLRPEEVTAVLGEAIHAGLRKAADSAEASMAYRAIDHMDDDEWHDVLMFAVEGMMQGGMVFHRLEVEQPLPDRPDDVSPAVSEWSPAHHELFPDNRPE